MIVDTHVHSSYSEECSEDLSSPRLILKMAKKRGLDAVCICDHDTTAGYRAALKVRRPDDPLVIPGCEVSTSRGHLLVIGLEQEWEKDIDPYVLVDEARSQGAVVVAPHPFYMSTISVSWLSRELRLAVEAFNAMASILVYPNLAASKFASKYNLPVTAGSDAHSFEIVGLGRTEFDGDDADDLVSAILTGRTRIYGSRPPLGFSVKFALRSLKGLLYQSIHPKQET